MRRRVVAAILGACSRELAHEVCATSCDRVAIIGGPGFEGLPLVALDGDRIAWALRSGADGLLLVQGSLHVDRFHLEALLDAFRGTRTPVASYVAGEVGLPAVFGVESYSRLATHDAREVLRTTPIVKAIPWTDGPEHAMQRAIDAAVEAALDDMLQAIPQTIPEQPTEPVILQA